MDTKEVMSLVIINEYKLRFNKNAIYNDMPLNKFFRIHAQKYHNCNGILPLKMRKYIVALVDRYEYLYVYQYSSTLNNDIYFNISKRYIKHMDLRDPIICGYYHENDNIIYLEYIDNYLMSKWININTKLILHQPILNINEDIQNRMEAYLLMKKL